MRWHPEKETTAYDVFRRRSNRSFSGPQESEISGDGGEEGFYVPERRPSRLLRGRYAACIQMCVVSTDSSTSTGNSCVVFPDECSCVQCGIVCKSKQAVRMHQIRVHSKKKSSSSKVSVSYVTTHVSAVVTALSARTVSSSSVSTDVCTVTNASSTNTVHSSAVSLEKYTCVSE